jgi:hypothetical protein
MFCCLFRGRYPITGLHATVFYFLKTVAVLVVMVASDVAGRSCEEQQEFIDLVLCVLRRMFSLLTLVLWSAGSVYAVISVARDCSLCKLLGTGISRLAGWDTVSLDTQDGDDHPHTTVGLGVACSSPTCTHMRRKR